MQVCRRLFVFLVCAAGMCSGCTASNVVPDEGASRTTLAWLQKRYNRIDDPNVDELSRRIMGRLAAALTSSDLVSQTEPSAVASPSSHPWNVVVLDTPEPNAFSLGMGNIVLTRGLVVGLNTEAELASVIAHEMSHELLGHIARAAAQASHQSSHPYAMFLPEEEMEADSLGVQILARAGYPPQSALTALVTYEHARESGDSEVMQRLMAPRIASLQEMIPKIDNSAPLSVNSRLFTRVRRELGPARAYE